MEKEPKLIGVHYSGYWYPEFINECKTEIQNNLMMRVALGDKITCLEKLAVDVLRHTNFLDIEENDDSLQT